MDDEAIAAQALNAYEAIADRFAEHSETSAHNAYCERPATLSLLPDVRGSRVLDAGCGPGFYSQWLAARGAEVVAVDGSAKMVALTRQRVGPSVAVRQWDLLRPLDLLEGGTLDLVLPALVSVHPRPEVTTRTSQGSSSLDAEHLPRVNFSHSVYPG
jgi:SAM-dependent methyltransferase